MKEKIRKLIEILKNKKYRSLIILIGYFVFFIIMFLILHIKMSLSSNRYIPKKEYKDYTNYEFNMNLNINDYVINYNGKRYDNNYIINYNDQIFTLETLQDINVKNSFQFTPELIDKIINNSTKISEKKIITTSINQIEYSLKLDKLIEILDYDLLYDTLDDVTILISSNDDGIVEVELDFSNLLKYYEESFQKYILKITYSNVDKVEKF